MKDNLIITLRERGKIVSRREGHNIWLNNGRTYLSKLVSFQSYGPDTFQISTLPSYIGFGIGGAKQSSLSIANSVPCSTHYPGPNNNSDLDPTISVLERPARISWATGPTVPTGTYGNYVYPAGDVWLRRLTLPTHPTTTSLQWTCSFSPTDFSAGPFDSVPLSEIGLMLSDASPNVYNNQAIAYDTFDTIVKTAVFSSMDIAWTLRF